MAKSIKLTALPILLFMVSAHSSAQEKKPEDVYRVSLPSVMTLHVEKRDGSVITGSAFLALKDGVAITAWHVIRDSVRAVARFSSGEEFEVSGVVDRDEKRDVAILRIKVFGRPTLPIASTQPDVGSRVYVIGAPRGLDFTISDGLLSQVREIGGSKQYQFSCPASPGNSGGPLLNSAGEVLGVVSWQVREGQNLSFAVPSNYVLGLDASLPTYPLYAMRASQPIAFKERSVPRSVSEVLSSAKSLCVFVTHGSPVLKTEISGKLIRWGKLVLVSTPDEADLVLYVVQTGRLNAGTGEGNQATALLKDRLSDVELWSSTKGGSWSLSGFKVSSVAKDIAGDFIKFFEKTVKHLTGNKK